MIVNKKGRILIKNIQLNMSIKQLLLCLSLFPFIIHAQTDMNASKAIKIEFLQSLNQLESLLNQPAVQLTDQRDKILILMDREVTKNNLLTEKLMKNPDRSQKQRDQIQEQLALTAKQKYIKSSFSELDWEGKKLSPRTTLDLVRNFMNLVQ